MINPMVMPIGGFDPNSEQYRCLCGNCHVVQATRRIVLIELIFLCVNFLAALIVAVYSVILPFIIWLAVIVILIIGMSRRNHHYLLPHLIVQVMSIVFLLVFAMFMIGVIIGSKAMARNMAQDTATHQSTSTTQQSIEDAGSQSAIILVAVTTLIVCLLAAALIGWTLSVVYHCYSYYKHRANQPMTGVTGIGNMHAVHAMSYNKQPNIANGTVAIWNGAQSDKPPPYSG